VFKLKQIISIALIFGGPKLWASLGDDESGINSDTNKLSAVQKSAVAHSAYKVHRLQLTTATVNEYASPSGKIFAVTWRGIAKPDLSVLLGAYYQEYVSAVKDNGRPRGRRATSLVTNHTKIEISGHMRDVRGRASIPSLVPAGVKVETLQ